MDNVFQDITEEIEVNQIDKTQKINFRLISKQYSDVEITFNPTIDSETGAIIITPENPDVVITDASLATISAIEGTTINEDDTATTIYPLEIHMIGDHEDDFEVVITTDQIGQAVILPAVSTTQIISATHSDNIELITEEIEEESEQEEKDEPTEETDKTPENNESETPEEEIPEVEAKVINESIDPVEPPITEGDEPYSQEKIESILVEVTDNFSSPNGVLKCGYEAETELTIQILNSNNYRTELVNIGDWHLITYTKREDEDTSSEIEESYEGTPQENKELASLVLDDVEDLFNQLSTKIDKLFELYTCLNIDIDNLEKFRTTLDNLKVNSFDDVSLSGLRDDLQRGSV